jgi:NAD(P)H-dependent FMN reductase
MLTVFVSFIALGVAGWALWVAFVAMVTARSTHQALAAILQRAAAEETAKEAALRDLHDQTLRHTEEVKDATARIQALRAQIRERQASLAIDFPLGSKRIQ